MAINIFDPCMQPSMGGIKRMKLATRDVNNNPLDFPLDILLKVNDESIIMLSDDEPNRTITIGGVQIQYRIVYPFNANFSEEEVTERQGRTYNRFLNFEMPQLSLTTNNQLKDFLFTSSGEFAISSMVAFIEDMNDVTWIIGWDNPLILQTFDLMTDVNGGDNKYVLSYQSKGYSRIRVYELQ
jgi:hypothetical protein